MEAEREGREEERREKGKWGRERGEEWRPREGEKERGGERERGREKEKRYREMGEERERGGDRYERGGEKGRERRAGRGETRKREGEMESDRQTELEGGRQYKKEEGKWRGGKRTRNNYSSILYIFCRNRTYSHLVIIFVYYITSGYRTKRGYPLVYTVRGLYVKKIQFKNILFP